MLAATKLRFVVVFFFLHLCHASHPNVEVEPTKDDCTQSEAETDPNCSEIQPTYDGSGSASKPNNSLGSGTDYDMVLQSKRGKNKRKCQNKNVKSKCKKSKRRPNARNFSRKRKADQRKMSPKRRKSGGKQRKQSGRKKQGFQNRCIQQYKLNEKLQYGSKHVKLYLNI